MNWFLLLIASIFEVGWPIGIKLAEISSHKIFWLVFALITMILSGLFLYFAQKNLPIGTAYAIWTGIGTVCTFLVGVYYFHDILSLMRILGVILIIAGIICLKV